MIMLYEQVREDTAYGKAQYRYTFGVTEEKFKETRRRYKGDDTRGIEALCIESERGEKMFRTSITTSHRPPLCYLSINASQKPLKLELFLLNYLHNSK